MQYDKRVADSDDRKSGSFSVAVSPMLNAAWSPVSLTLEGVIVSDSLVVLLRVADTTGTC